MRGQWTPSNKARDPGRRPSSFIACAIYTRQSVAHQDADEFSSCKTQRLACLRFLASRLPELWLPVGGVFDDVGCSGATLERPGILALLERIAEEDIDRVVVHRFDRLTRNFRDWLTLVRVFEKHGVRLSVVSGELNTGELATENMTLNVLASFAELEREMICDRLRDARAARRQRGLRSAGRVPFGYASDPRTRQLVPNEPAAYLVREIFRRAAAGERPAAIAAWVNEEDEHVEALATKARGSLSTRTVLRMLRNPVYVGDLGGQGEAVEGAHPALVARDVFDVVQEIISRRRTRAPTARSDEMSREDPFLLRGLVTCSACGNTMTTSASRALSSSTKRGRRRSARDIPRYYRCRGSRPCTGSQVAARDLEENVVCWLSEASRDQLPEHVSERLRYLMTAWSMLWQVNRQRLLRALVEELRWDGKTSTFTIVLNEDWIVHGHEREAESEAEPGEVERDRSTL